MATESHWLHNAFHIAAEKFPDVVFAAVRPTKFDNWPLVPSSMGGNCVGLPPSNWRGLREYTSAAAIYEPICVTWLRIAGELWEGGFFISRETPDAVELENASVELKRLACQACDEFGIPETVPVSDGCLRPGFMARWLEFVCAMPHVQVSGENLGFAIRRLSNVFRASARAVDSLIAKPFVAAAHTPDESADSADREFAQALEIAKSNLLDTERRFFGQTIAAVPTPEETANWKEWNLRKERIEKDLSRWHERELAKYGWTIGNSVPRDDKNFAQLAKINRQLQVREYAMRIALGIGKHCRSCGAARPQNEWGADGHCDHCAKQWNDSLIPLLRDFATNPSRLKSYTEWPSIQHFACELFAHPVFTDETLTRLKNWLIAEHGLTENQVHELAREMLVRMLETAVESSRKAGGAHVREEAAITGGEQSEIAILSQPPVHDTKSVADNATKTDAPAEAFAIPAATDSSSNMLIEPQGSATLHEPKQFSGGTMMFFAKRVELCGVDICSGPRSQARRKTLETLRNKGSGGEFVPYSSEELAKQADLKGGQNTAAGVIRDLRKNIEETLRARGIIVCSRTQVILSGGPGYRFSKLVNVQHENQVAGAQIADMAGEDHVPNVLNTDVPNDAAATRRVWILRRLASGDQLQAPDVAKQFKCSTKTAQRDLQALKDEGRIKFVGATRTGYYLLVPRAEPSRKSGRKPQNPRR